MNEIIEVGDIVISRSHGKKGKVVKLKTYDRSALVEVIVKRDKEAGTRTTKILAFPLSDLRHWQRKPNKDIEESIVKPESVLTDRQKELFANAPKLELTAEALKNMEEAIKLNRIIKSPKVAFPKMKGDE
ncbi:hypothetical protein V7122_19405 [Bacillus sp. JJ1532]|uniref:hypothetical protein n=1 Tax=Bacillus sp. JJ1532 TaxID=3122958 RepID=UPI002FFE2483